MIKKLVLLTALTCYSLFALSEASDTASQTSELLSMQQKRFEAMVKADISTLKSIFAEDLTYTHTNGETETKSSFLSTIETATFKYESIETTSTNVRIYGDTGVITGKGKIKLLAFGSPMSMEVSFIEVQVKSGGRWQLIAWQTTRIF
jgi:hypothetical protein